MCEIGLCSIGLIRPVTLKVTIACILVGALGINCLNLSGIRAFSYVKFVGSTGWICGAQCFKSTDDGETWEMFIDTRPEEYFTADGRWRFQVINSKVALNSIDGHLHRTLDGGETWELINENEFIAGFRFRDPSLGLAFGRNYKTLYSVDAGDNWSRSLDFHLQAVAFDQDSLFGVAGTSLLTARSVTGPWQKLAELPQAIWNLKVLGRHVWLVGDLGLCIRYNKITREIQDFSLPGSSGRDLFDIGFGRGWKIVVGTGGALFVSKIEDTDWHAASVPASVPNQSLMSIAFNSRGDAFVVGGTASPVFPIDPFNPRRIVLRSTDLEHWQRMYLN